MAAFKSFDSSAPFDGGNQGFHMTFDNGFTVSVQWGKRNYCDEGETTAEVAVWDTRRRGEPFVYVPGFSIEDDDVIPRQTPEQVAALMEYVSRAFPSELRNRKERV